MKATQRQAAMAVGFLALSLTGARAFAQQQRPAQRGGPPGQDTPYILVTTFHSSDHKLGVEAGDELRRRLQNEHSAKDLFVVTKHNINSVLEASGYKPDSALSPSDLMELSKALHGEYVIDGKATRLGARDSVRLETRILMRTGTTNLAQPLPTISAEDVGDGVKAVEKAISEALKGMPKYRACVADLRARKYDQAVADARLGLAAYSNSVLSRVCMLQAQGELKAPADSIISNANAILAVDPTNLQALANLVDAYKGKGDKDKAIEINLRIWRLDPTNQSIANSIVTDLAQSGAPDKALQILDTLLKQNPQDPSMIRTKWLLELNARQFKNALATGETLMKVDSAAADTNFFTRQIAAAQSDSNTAKVQEWAERASQKFPKEVTFVSLLAQGYMKAGQLPQALQAGRRLAQINPKSTDGWAFAMAAANQLNEPDTVMALGREALAAGADPRVIGQGLSNVANAALKKAQASKTRDDWETSLQVAQIVDSLAPTDNSKFFVGVSAFQVGYDAIQQAQELAKDKNKKTLKASRAKACEETKVVEDTWATAQIALPRGASLSKETAAQLMGAIQQYSTYIPQMKTAYCGGK